MRTKEAMSTLLLVTMLAGQALADRTSAPQSSTPSTASEALEVAPITEADAEAFASQWLAAIRTGDLEAGADLIALDDILDRALEGSDPKASFRAGFKAGLGGKLTVGLLSNLNAIVESGGSYRWIDTRSHAGSWFLVFRLLHPDSGLNYHELRLVRGEHGVRVNQIYVALTGEPLAETIRHMLAGTVDLSFVDRLNGKAQEDKQRIEQVGRIARAVKSESWEEAISIYDELPREWQSKKQTQSLRLMALANLDEKDYLAAIDEYAQLFPGDPSLALTMINAAILREDAPMLRESMGMLMEWTGGDPFLQTMLAGNLASLGHVEEAVALMRDLDVFAISLADAHEYAIYVSVPSNDHAATLLHLVALRDEYDLEYGNLNELDFFAEFVKSPEFEVWQG